MEDQSSVPGDRARSVAAMMTATPYESLVAAAAQLTDTDVLGDIDENNVSVASASLARNCCALEAARRALGPQCTVSLRFEEAFFADHCDDLSHLRNLARAFRAEALRAAGDNDYRTAAEIGIDILELANAARRGGLVTDLLVSAAISAIGIEGLRRIRTKFDHGTRRLLIEQLRRLEAEREPFTEIVARDHKWEMAVGYKDEPCDFMSMDLADADECGLSEDDQRDLLQLLQHIGDLPETDRRRMECDQDRHILALMRMLVVDLALREWHASSGSFPDDLASLTAQMLPKLPLDPFTETSFIYRRVGDTSFHLYSTGPKSCDGGGQFGDWTSVAAGSADLCLDAGDYWRD
jgi:hypothetical protein